VVDCLFGLTDTMYDILGVFFTLCNKTTLALSFERRRDSRAVWAAKTQHYSRRALA
jgi:hypothetical protein